MARKNAAQKDRVEHWVLHATHGTDQVVPGASRLTSWLVGARTQSWLAQRLGVSHPTVYRWCAGQYVPDPEYRRQIHDLSRGEVHYDDWYTPWQLATAYAYCRGRAKRFERRMNIQEAQTACKQCN